MKRLLKAIKTSVESWIVCLILSSIVIGFICGHVMTLMATDINAVVSPFFMAILITICIYLITSIVKRIAHDYKLIHNDVSKLKEMIGTDWRSMFMHRFAQSSISVIMDTMNKKIPNQSSECKDECDNNCNTCDLSGKQILSRVIKEARIASMKDYLEKNPTITPMMETMTGWSEDLEDESSPIETMSEPVPTTDKLYEEEV